MNDNSASDQDDPYANGAQKQLLHVNEHQNMRSESEGDSVSAMSNTEGDVTDMQNTYSAMGA